MKQRSVGIAGAIAASLFFTPYAAHAAETVTYKYDALGRLVTKTNSGTVNAGKKVTICYDAAGNRKVYKVAANGTAVVCFAPVPTP